MPDWNAQWLGRDLRLHYLDNGPKTGRPVLLLHGLGVDSSSWLFQEQALRAAGLRPLIPDIPGFGKSTLPGIRWSFTQAAQVLLQFSRQLDSRPIHLAGISLGGALALSMLAEAPNLFDRVVLINSFTRLRPQGWRHLIYMLSRLAKVALRPMPEQARYMAERLFPSAEDAIFREMIVTQILGTDPAVYRRVLFSLGRLNLEHEAGEVRNACLVITGEEDSTVPPTLQAQLVERLSHCRQITIPDAGHAVIVQQPGPVNQAMLGFLSA